MKTPEKSSRTGIVTHLICRKRFERDYKTDQKYQKDNRRLSEIFAISYEYVEMLQLRFQAARSWMTDLKIKNC